MYITSVRTDFLNKFLYLIIAAVVASSVLTGCSDEKKKSDDASASGVTDQGDTFPESSAGITTEASTEAPTKEPVRNIEKAEGTYIYDYAKMLSDADFNECNDYAEWLYENYLINTAVVITDNIEGLTPEQYAQEAYIDLYSGRGSGLLLLVNNDTNEDYLYKTGSCLASISEEAQANEFYWATQEIIEGDVKSAILRLMKLGEACPQHVFDNGGIFSSESIEALENACTGGANDISVLATSNSTGTPNEEICRTYYDRHYQGKNGIMIMLDTASDTLTVVSDGQLPADIAELTGSADVLAAAKNYTGAVESLINALKG